MIFDEIPAWAGCNEVRIVRAQNGTLVAALRTDLAKKFVSQDPATGEEIALALYEGLGCSISADDGDPWSTVKKLYDWGHITSAC